MVAVQFKTRSHMIEEPLHVNDIWLLAVLEEMWVSSAFRLHKIYNNDSVMTDCVALAAPNYDLIRHHPQLKDYQIMFDSLEERWYEYAGFYADLNPRHFGEFSAVVINEIRTLLLNNAVRSSVQVGRLLDLYHRGFDEYIDYFINVWNVYYLDFQMVDAESNSLGMLKAFNEIAWKPSEMAIIGDPTDVYTASPALWVELRDNISPESQMTILNLLMSMNIEIIDTIRPWIRLALKDRILHDLVRVFYPASLAYVKVVPMEPIYQQTIPSVTQAISCAGEAHVWNMENAFTDDVAICRNCGLTRSVTSFSVEELDELIDVWE